MPARPSIDQYLMGLAVVVKSRSDWPGTKVGCVAAFEGMVRSTGYNGTPKGWEPAKHLPLEKYDEGDRAREIEPRMLKPYYCHAEENAIVQAARAGVKLEGCTFYSTLSCCLPCARMMVNAGAAGFVFLQEWDGQEAEAALQLLGACGIHVSKLSI